MESPTVSLVVVTYDSAGDLPAFINSLPAALEGVEEHELIVVDCDSHDGTLAVAARLAPEATLVPLGWNGGYAAGINAGINASTLRGPIAVLNSDLGPEPGSFLRLVRALQAPGTGITTPRLVDEHGRTRWSLRREPTFLRALGESVAGGSRAARHPAFGETVLDPDEYERPVVADWATGAALCISRACLDAVGPWDESFFLYSEETDYALRARDCGFRLRYVPDAVISHAEGDSHTSAQLYALLCANRVYGYRKRHGTLASTAYWSAIAFGLAMRAAAGRAQARAGLAALCRPQADVVARARS